MADLSVRDVARLLAVAEKTVHRWVRDGEIPCYRLRGDVRFNRVELQEWAQERGHAVAPDLFGDVTPDGPLSAALARGGIARALPGTTRDEVLDAVAALPGVPPEIDRRLLADVLRARERLGSTGLGHGLAIPHPRDPLVLHVTAPVLLLALLAQPVDFGAPDGQPVTTLFVILAPGVQDHLQTLSRLAFVLHDAEVLRLLAERAPDAALLDAIRVAERRAPAAPPDEDDA
jgi:PTS system nitrogen regulatory IIA component